jgi:antitoxin (DNA-binding transcriptional repressor) of toxin-antitoxin stability system
VDKLDGSSYFTRIIDDMSEEPVTISADDLHAAATARAPMASAQAAVWDDAVRRAEQGETVAVIAHGEHIADVVPSGELDRLRETIEVLSDPELMRDLQDREPVVVGMDAIRALIGERIARERP